MISKLSVAASMRKLYGPFRGSEICANCAHIHWEELSTWRCDKAGGEVALRDAACGEFDYREEPQNPTATTTKKSALR